MNKEELPRHNVLYDNQEHRTDDRLKEADGRFLLRFAVSIALLSLFVIAMDAIFTSTAQDSVVIRFAVMAPIILFFVVLALIDVHSHMINRKGRLMITEQAIVLDSGKEAVAFATIEKIIVRHASALIKFKNQKSSSMGRVLPLRYIWDISKFEEALRRCTVVEDMRSF